MKRNVITFISNNVNEFQTPQKRMKLFEYLKNHVATNGFFFLHETHSLIRDDQKWEDKLRGKLFFSHGKKNSCGVLIGYYGTKKVKIINNTYDNYGRILLLEINIDHKLFVLMNEIRSKLSLTLVKLLTVPMIIKIKI